MTSALLRRLFPRDVHHVTGFRQELAARLPTVGRVLDLGCGANTELEDYRTDDRDVWGADFEAHPHLRHPDRFRALRPNGSIPFPNEHFDAVTAVMVLEHVADPVAFFREVARVLRPGGHFIGHTVSGAHYVTWIRRAFGLLPHSVNQLLVRRLYGRPEVDTFPAYYRLNSRRQIRRACGPAGLRLVRVRRYADPGYFAFARWTAASAVVLDRLLAGGSSACGRLYFTAVLAKARD